MPDSQLHELRLGVFTTASIVAIANGLDLFSTHGISVDAQEVKGSGEQMEGLRDGRFDVVHTSPDNIMKSRLMGDDVFVFFVLDMGLPQLLAGRSGVADWDALAGGRIGVDDPSSGFAFVVYEMLHANGVDVDACTIESVGSSRQRLDSLLGGSIDAGLLSAAMTTQIEKAGLNVLAAAADVVPWYPGIAAATSRSVAEDRPELLTAYAASLHEAMVWLQDPANAQNAASTVAAATKTNTVEAAAVLKRESASRTKSLPTPAEAAEAIQRIADLRERYTGQRVEGTFEDRWMRALANDS